MWARRISPGHHRPLSRSALSFAEMTRHCACSASTVIPSGPGAPLFDTTFDNAEPSRSTTSFIVAGTHVRSLTIAFGTPAAALPPEWSGDRLREPPCGACAVAIGNRSCDAASSTGIAFPCPPVLEPAGLAGITPPSGTTRSSDFCWAIDRRPFVLRPTGQPGRDPADLPGQGVEIWPRSRRQYARRTNRNRASLPRASSPSDGRLHGASLSFATTAHLRLLSDPPSRKPAGHAGRRRAARSIPCRALASSMLDSPCWGSRSGLSPPISTSCPAHALALRAHYARRRAGGILRKDNPRTLMRRGPMKGGRPDA